MSLALWIITLGLTVGAPPEVLLCVELPGERVVEARELLAAIRARMERADVRVERCDGRPGADFRVELTEAGSGRVKLQFRGPEVEGERSLNLTDLGRQEISQTIALTVVEVVRRPVDALLVRTGRAVPTPAPCSEPKVTPCPACPDCPPATAGPPATPGPTCPPAEPCPPAAPCPSCPEPPAPVELQPDLHLSLGLVPGLNLGDQGWGLWAGVEVALAFGPLRLQPHFGAVHRFASGVVDLWSLELGLSGKVAIGPLAFGVGLVERAQRVQVAGTTNADGTRGVLSPGAVVLIDLELLRLGAFDLGLALRAWGWPNPTRFRVDGALVREESAFEVGVFPRVTFWAL